MNMVEKPNLSICIREYIDLRIGPLSEKYEKSEARLKDTRDEVDRRLEATYATIREVDSKIEKALTRIYEIMAAVFLLLLAAFVAHILGKV
jgi:hypothetical protein